MHLCINAVQNICYCCCRISFTYFPASAEIECHCVSNIIRKHTHLNIRMHIYISKCLFVHMQVAPHAHTHTQTQFK